MAKGKNISDLESKDNSEEILARVKSMEMSLLTGNNSISIHRLLGEIVMLQMAFEKMTGYSWEHLKNGL